MARMTHDRLAMIEKATDRLAELHRAGHKYPATARRETTTLLRLLDESNRALDPVARGKRGHVKTWLKIVFRPPENFPSEYHAWMSYSFAVSCGMAFIILGAWCAIKVLRLVF